MTTTSTVVEKPGSPADAEAPVLVVTRSRTACRRIHRQFGEDRAVIAVDAWGSSRAFQRSAPTCWISSTAS